MRAFLTGGNGFVGTNLIRHLLNGGHDVTVLLRDEKKGLHLPRQVSLVVGDSVKPGGWQEAVAEHDLLVNLAGAGIFKRWDSAYKQLLRDSRILTTRNLVEAIPQGSTATLLSTSAVGYYGFRDDEELDETSPPGTDFLARLATDWELEALKAQSKGVRVVITRFGVVLGRDGGALAQMTLPFRFLVGGPLGDGRQWISWIHIDDLCRATLFAATHDSVKGPVNFTAPGSVTNRELSRSIGKVMGRPSFLPAPGFMIKLVMGEFGDVILKGQRVIPKVLLENGFSFTFPTIDRALRDLLVD